MAKTTAKGAEDEFGSYMMLNGRRIGIRKNETDFSVMAPMGKVAKELSAAPEAPEALAAMAPSLTRARARDRAERDRLMEQVRESAVAHHIYQLEETDEEVVINDEIILELKRQGTGELEAIMAEYALQYVRAMGDAHVLRLTDKTGSNPIKVANRIAARPEVASCSPQILIDLQMHQLQPLPALFTQQWYLSAELAGHQDVLPDVGIRAPEAWRITRGSDDIVVAVMDDGFDLGHPAFDGVKIHPAAYDYLDRDPVAVSEDGDYHGTPVASIAVGAHGATMRGIAPGCTFLPVRVGFGSQKASQIDFLAVFQFVSKHADVVNCSFGTPPRSFDVFDTNFRKELTKLCTTGGRRGKGLVMVFSAGNDDSPTYLAPEENVNGVLFTASDPFGGTVIREIPPGQPVYSGYPMTPGVVVVGAMSSLKRKSGYSCWGPHVTVTAPSSNGHYIAEFVRPGSDARRTRFVANYRGLGQVAACNRKDFGIAFDPIGEDDPLTPNLREDQFTRSFGGTSGAAPVVTGVVALMLSANPSLTAAQVRRILVATADRNLDPTLDLAGDPNLQGKAGDFTGDRSPFFGAGKVDAAAAVQRAQALTGNAPDVTALPGTGAAAAAGQESAGLTASEVLAADGLGAVAIDPRLCAALLRAGGSVVMRGDVAPREALALAQTAARFGTNLTMRNPVYPPSVLLEIVRAGSGRVTVDFS